jgi:site-specific DNA-methyltransferase (adenine-specific)/modification methylase
MARDSVLMRLGKCSVLLGQCHSAEEAKRIIALSEAAKVYAKRVGASREVVNQAAEYKLRAERRLGELLKETPKAKGIQLNGRDAFGGTRVKPPRAEATLADHGISKRLSCVSQRLAAIPAEVFEEMLATARSEGADITRAIFRSAIRDMKGDAREERIRNRERELAGIPGDGTRLICADFAEAEIADASLDAIITDPPYANEFLESYRRLGEFAARKLKRGGNLLVLTGQAHLFDFFAALAASGLTYVWMLAYCTPGVSTQMWVRKVKSNFKPLLWFVKGTNQNECVSDMVTSGSIEAADTRFHEWGQDVTAFCSIVERFTVKGALVCDPFMGGGTTGLACLATQRRFLGIDHDRAAVESVRSRLS